MERMKIIDLATAIFSWDNRVNYDVMIFQNVNIKLNPRFIATIHTIHYPAVLIWRFFFLRRGLNVFTARVRKSMIFLICTWIVKMQFFVVEKSFNGDETKYAMF